MAKAKKYKDKKGATGKKYTTYSDRIKVTYGDGSTRTVRPGDASYNVTKKAMESDIGAKKWYKPAGNSKTTAETAVVNQNTGKSVKDGQVLSGNVNKKAQQNMQEWRKKNGPSMKDAVVYGAESGANSTLKGTQAFLQSARSNLMESNYNKRATTQNLMSGLLEGEAKAKAQQQMAQERNDYLQRKAKLDAARRQTAAEQVAYQQALGQKYKPQSFGTGQKVVSDVTGGVVGMLPAIAAAPMSGAAAGSAAGRALLPRLLPSVTQQAAQNAAARATSYAILGMIAEGSGENQALNAGASLEDATKYGRMSAGKEIGTELMFGGIPYLGKGVFDPAKHVTNRAAKVGLEMLGEGVEEGAAEAIDPFLQRATYDQNAQNASLQDIAYTAAIGGLTSGALKGGAHIAGNAKDITPKLTRAGEVMRQNQQEKADTALFGQNLQQRLQQQEEIRRQNAQTVQNPPQQVQNQRTTDNTTLVPNVAQVQNNKADNFTPQEMAVKKQDGTSKPINSGDIPIQNRTMDNIKGKKVNAYMYDHPEVKPAMQQQAEILLQELNNGVNGGRVYGVDPETRNATALGSVKSLQASTITDMRNAGMTNAQIKDGLQRIITDNGKENAVNGKRAELFVHDSLQNGYTSLDGEIPVNLDYVYRGMNVEQLQEEVKRLGNSFSAENTDEQNASIANQIQQINTLAIHRLNQKLGELQVAYNNATSYEEQAQYVGQAKAIRAQMDALQEAQQDIAPQVEQPEAEVDFASYKDYDLNKLRPDVVDFYEQLGEVGGKAHFNVRIVQGLEKGTEGMIDNQGNILLNGDNLTSAETIHKAAAHEVYHAMKGLEEHRDIQDQAYKYYVTKHPNATQEDMLREKIAQYYKLSGGKVGADITNVAWEDVDNNLKELAWDEVGAAFMGDALTDPKVADRIWNDNPSLFQRIARMIDTVLQKFKYIRMSDVARKQYDIYQEARKLYAKGLQSMQYNGLQQQDAQPRQMFAGEKSQTADLDALARAKQMAASGADMESIRQETGWFRSKVTGGKWAYEIDDSNAEYRASGDARLYANPKYRRKQELEYRYLYSMLGEAEPLTDAEQTELERLQEIFSAETVGKHLDDYLYHPELYKAYPELAHTKFAEDELNGIYGYHSRADNKIVIDPRFDAKDSILHETQHAVQGMEGFPSGSSRKHWQDVLDDGQRWLEGSRHNLELYYKDIGLPAYIDESVHRLKNGEITIQEHFAGVERFKKESKYADVIARLEAEKQEYLDKRAASLGNQFDSGDLYRNTAGEIMARDTERRGNWDEANRRKIAPAMGDENTVYAGKGGTSYSMDERAAERFAKQVDEVLSGKSFESSHVMVGKTPKALKYVGYPDLPIFMTAKHIRTMANKSGNYKDSHYHGMGADLVKQIPEAIEKPLLIAESNTRDDSVVLLTRLIDKQGQAVIAAVKFDGNAYDGGVEVEANILTSAYGKKSVNSLFNQNNILYVSKKESSLLSNIPRLQLPNNITTMNFNANVARFREKVKKSMQRKGNSDVRYSLSNVGDTHKQSQLDIVLNSNPMQDDYHTGIRSVDDICTYAEAIENDGMEDDDVTPDYTAQMVEKAKKSGKITVYSSYPIGQGVFVTPSKMEAESYAGGGKVHKKVVNLTDVAWIDSLQGQYAQVNENDIRYSLNDMVDQYGAIPAGENPMGTNRDVQVPKRTSDFDKVRKGTGTAMEAQQVADETVAGIEQELTSDVQSGIFTYEPTSNKADLAEANRRIAANGWEETGRQLHEAVVSGRRINSADMATLERLIQEAQKAGQYDKAVDFVSDLAVIGTESGQNIQAIRMLKRLTPEGQLMTLKNAQRRINNSLINKGQPTVPEISGEVAQEFLQARGNQKRNEIWDREITRMAQQTEGSWMDKLNAIRYAAMLSNPRTHIRNLIGNCAMQAARVPTNIISAALEDAVSLSQKRLKPGGMEQNRSLKNKTGQSSKELRKYAEMAWTADGEAAMRNVGNRYDDVSGQFAQNQRVFGHTVAGNVLEALAGNGKRSVGSVLDAEDMWFKHATYVNTLVAYMKANGITTRDAALNVVKPNGASIGKGMEYAGLQAQKATFTEDNKAANNISKLENTNLGTQLAFGAILPFKKTPMNIITRGVEYSPVGLLMTGYKLQDAARHQKTVKEYDELENRYSKKKVARESKYTVNDVLESLAANLTGSGLLAAGIYFASQGMLASTGDDDDKRKEQYDQQMGDQNFAVVLDDGSTYTIDWLAPAAMPLLTGVEVYNQLFSGKYDETDETLVSRALSAAGKIADPVFEMSCMQGVASALASYSGDAGDIASTLVANIGTGYAGQFIPAPVGALARTIDDTVRSSYASKDSPYTKTGESFLRQQRSKLPRLSKQNEASIDVWGNERKREFAGSDPSDVAMRVVMNFISPGNYSSNKRTELDNKLTELYEATGDSGVLPKRADSYIKRDGEPTVYLSPYEYSRFSTTKGKKSQKYAGDFTSSDAYKNLDDTTKADIVASLYGLANYEAKKEALKGRGIDYSDKAYENALESGVKPYEYYATKERFSGKWSNYDMVKEYAEHADKMGMKDSKYVAVYDSLGELHADTDRRGKSVSGSRQKKVAAYLNKELQQGNITKEQWWYFYTKEYPSQAKNAPYAWIREANKKKS